ncbi:helix-turn-helix transcriptional regulator [Pseudoalteromonas sp. SWXJZ94C]|uniref:response regulator transcription factor n=1 Tax=unclassified Pseudoalteromonas TaxID=194690 RepID=UPI00140B456B|nr:MULTISPECIES: LuxR C-terminal-related transcriptional regulator [unclassified Pseudoalteromonas]MBH0059273.1 helix-turn-helix transcriptional regulator [Pseudoalteromonas sp. SWXJZ94C]
MPKPLSVFVKTTFKSHPHSENYVAILKTLQALFGDIKMDDALPKAEERLQYDLFLIDGFNNNWQDLIPADLIFLAKKSNIVIFNVDKKAVCEKNLLLNHFNGVFYKTDAHEDIFKGLVRISAGELWFTRKVISKAFSDILSVAASFNSLHEDIELKQDDYNHLTKRERSVIHLIAQGASNNKIADKLNISDHTVKTHLYSAFKKTNSRNRVELANWAQRYISVLLPMEK